MIENIQILVIINPMGYKEGIPYAKYKNSYFSIETCYDYKSQILVKLIDERKYLQNYKKTTAIIMFDEYSDIKDYADTEQRFIKEVASGIKKYIRDEKLNKIL